MAALNTVSIVIVPDAAQPPSRRIDDIPWYPGMTVLSAMMVGDAMFADTFTFRLIYRSFYGAWVDSIDGYDDTQTQVWMLYVDGVLSDYGVSDTILRMKQAGSHIELVWKFEPVASAQAQVAKKLQATSPG